MSEDASLRAAAYGQGRIFQSERDIQITEHHHHGAPDTSASANGPASVRVASAAPLRAALRDREELREELLTALDADGGVHVLHGFGGCGKTAVARWLFDQSVPSRVALWVDASTELQLRAGMLAVAADRGASPEEVRAAQEGRRAAADLVWQRLDASPEPWLLVLDNADDPRPLRDGWLRSSSRGTVLVTSRQAADPAWTGARARMHRVGVLPVVEAAHLLHDLTPGEHQPEATLRLAQRLGCHPPALTLAGGFLSQQLLESWTVEEYLERLGEDPVTLLDRGAGLESGARERLSRTWQLSLDALTRRGLPEATAILRLLACWGHAPVPLALLAPSALVAVGVPGLAAERVEAGLHGLLSASLVDLFEVPGGADGRRVRCVTAHGLLLETIKAGVPAGQRTELYGAAAALVSRAVLHGGDASTTRLAEPHLVALLENSFAVGSVLEAARRVRDTYDVAGRWADALPFASGVVKATPGEGAAGDVVVVADAIKLGEILHMSGDFAGAEPVLNKALDGAMTWAEESPLLQADACFQLSHCYGKSGRNAETIRLLHRAGEIRQRVLGPTHADTVETVVAQADNQFLLGNYGVSLRLAHQLTDLVPNLHGERSDDVAARALLVSAAAMRHAQVARTPESPWRATVAAPASDAIAEIEAQELSWDLVWERAQAALDAHVPLFGPDHPRTAAARHNLALAASAHDDQETAIAEFRRTVAIRTAHLGTGHPWTIQASGGLAHCLALQGDTDEASTLADKAYADALRILGPKHFITVGCAAAQKAASS
ncbi:tetratricopeptide repeat protein [Streptomyces sp. NBC_01003]|uniref:tetratricopeptide repeat protein n=1 Tax=Streptomyces sp. NBC_01003 TaxID=2903714 RepID=UPI00386FFF0C|nr:tetratricopeptide repeat protein [Streptomyces sp. NBC_01003]